MNLENPYFTSNLITYLGNKRKLLGFINDSVEEIKGKLGKERLTIFDGFSGSGATSRLFKYHAEKLYINDLEQYSYIVNKCYLANKSEIDLDYIQKTINWLNETAQNNLKTDGFIYKNYAPKNDEHICRGERVFYTAYNAKILDTLKDLIFTHIPLDEQYLFLGPLLVKASIHTNTSGVFKGFHKKDGIGCFGGAGENALKRILQPIELEMPIFSDIECELNVFKADTNDLVKSFCEKEDDIDVIYYDPPYNQHPYGSNYFMLNILAEKGEDIEIQNGVSGITKDWNHSAYNNKERAILALDDLVRHSHAKYILLSYNNEGLIPFDVFGEILGKYGEVSVKEYSYNAYRGSRNLSKRSPHVTELLWLVTF